MDLVLPKVIIVGGFTDSGVNTIEWIYDPNDGTTTAGDPAPDGFPDALGTTIVDFSAGQSVELSTSGYPSNTIICGSGGPPPV